MGSRGISFQLNSTTLCEHHCYHERELKKKKCRLHTSLPFSNSLLVQFSLSASSCEAPQFPRLHKHVSAEARPEPSLGASIELHDHKDAHNDVNGHDECTARNQSLRSDDVPDGHDECTASSPSNAATAEVDDGALNEVSVPSASNSSNGVHQTGQHDYTARNSSNATTDLDAGLPHAHAVSEPAGPSDLPCRDEIHDAEGHDTCSTGAQHDASTSIDPSNAGGMEGNGKIRRFSLNEPGLLKTLQGSKALSPLEQENLDLVKKFKLSSDSVKGQLVIRAVRTEQVRDLEDLLTDSYSELMWGPLTYRPALVWILSTYLRERQAYLPHAVTLVGLYSPSEEETNDPEVSPHKWWLAGAVEISFNASGKPKDMQTPVPPKDAPFLSNMAVMKKFRRRGIGRELLRAAEQLAVQMGGNEMYLHCRMIDEAPLNMYKKSGYAIVETDSIISLLLFQRRRHLMYKALAAPLHEGTMVQLD